jgi:two-component system cell cycle sensor histidine kinase/response regulator CckA
VDLDGDSVSPDTIRPGEPPGILASTRDITARKRLEEQMQQSQKLEAVGRLAGGIAHDFNNLLTAILGEVDVANGELPDGHPAREALEGVSFAVERAAALTAQLLIFSRHQVTQPRLLDLNAVLLTLDRMLRRVIGENVELVTRLAKDLPTVRADEAQIGQVVLNLAVNARDAMPNGGTLTIETQRVRLDEDYVRTHAGVIPGEYALIAITDTGSGMTPEVAAHIFEPFFTSKAVGKGTGLGLATCHGIVAEAGGHLWFYTEPGLGTTFKAYLPTIAGELAPTREAAPAKELRGAETILLVEDEPSVRVVTSRMLRSLGYTILEAAHGEAGLALASTTQQPLHLVISDIVMPHMGGRELVARLREEQPGLRALFISGYAEDAITRNGPLEGDVVFLQKPFTRPALARAVREALES